MKRILALFVVLVFVGFGSGCGGSQDASSHDFIDLETNYNLSDIAAPLYKHLKENSGYGYDDDSYIAYLCDPETDWETIFFPVSAFCADVSCPLRGLDANGCVEHCKKFLKRPSDAECAAFR